MFETVTKNGRVLALIPADRTIPDGDAALELAVSARYETDSTRLVIPKECFPPEFFWLSTGLAGEILQKWTNYGFGRPSSEISQRTPKSANPCGILSMSAIGGPRSFSFPLGRRRRSV